MTKLGSSKSLELGLTQDQAERLITLMRRSADLVGISAKLLEKGYNGVYPTRRDLMLECAKLREAIESLEQHNDIIARTVRRGR